MEAVFALYFKDLSGAGNEARTRDLNLGKVALYQLSYSRRRAEIVAPDGLLSRQIRHFQPLLTPSSSAMMNGHAAFR